MSPRFLGYGFAILGVLIISPDSALIRKVGMDPSALLFWRGFGIFVVSAALSVLWYRGRLWSYFTESGVLGLLIALFFFISTCSFVYSAVTLNPIILLIFVALGPVSGAVFSIILLNEPPRPAVWIAIGLSFLGMVIVVWGEKHGAGTLVQLRAGQRLNLPGPLSLLALILVPTLLGLGLTLARQSQRLAFQRAGWGDGDVDHALYRAVAGRAQRHLLGVLVSGDLRLGRELHPDHAGAEVHFIGRNQPRVPARNRAGVAVDLGPAGSTARGP